MHRWNVRGTGIFPLDSTCALGLFEIAHRADPLCKATITLNQEIILKIKFGVTQNELQQRLGKVLSEMRELREIFSRLKFKVNVGKRRLTVKEVFDRIVEGLDISKLVNPQLLAPIKERRKGVQTLYMSLMPLYGKGLRLWDEGQSGESARVNDLTLLSYLLGLVFYGLQFTAEGARTHVVFAPALDVAVDETYAYCIRRMANYLVTTWEMRKYVSNLRDVPTVALLLAVLSQLDLPSLTFLSDCGVNLWLFTHERDPRGGERITNCELLSSGPLIPFLYRLHEHYYDFKRCINAQCALLDKKEVKQLLRSILVDIARSILDRSPDRMILALRALRDRELMKQLFLPGMDAAEGFVNAIFSEVSVA